jgi:hypothetical protein
VLKDKIFNNWNSSSILEMNCKVLKPFHFLLKEFTRPDFEKQNEILN